jgi:hypothetical protein
MDKRLLTHSDLVDSAMRWLRKSCPVVVTELATVGEEADAIGFKDCISTLVECKASRSDFLADKKKSWRKFPDSALGDYRYYCCPRGLISVSELPDRWGLLEASGSKAFITHKACLFEPRSFKRTEISILVSVLRRIGQNPPQGVSIRCYTFETKNRATVSIEAATDFAEYVPYGDEWESELMKWRKGDIIALLRRALTKE